MPRTKYSTLKFNSIKSFRKRKNR